MKSKRNIAMKAVRTSITKFAEKKRIQTVLDLCTNLRNLKSILKLIKRMQPGSYIKINAFNKKVYNHDERKGFIAIDQNC